MSASADQPTARDESIPTLGTLAWAEAVEKTRDDFYRADNTADLVARSARLLALYHGCTVCRDQIYRLLDYKLKEVYRDENALTKVQEVEFAHDPVSLGRLLARTGRAQEAKRIVTAELRHTRFLERRLALLEVLAEADTKLGDQASARKLARQLLEKAPASPNYCEKALHWMAWLGEEALPDEEFTIPAVTPATFRRVREMEAQRGNDTYVSCLFNHELLSWDRYVREMQQVHVRVDDDVLALCPNGIDVPQQELARRTTDPKARASILLNVARRQFPRAGPVSIRLISEAKAAGSAPSIQAGAKQMEFATLNLLNDRKEIETLALELIGRFPNSEASCEACEYYWYAITYPWPAFSNRIPEWREKCLSVINGCPDRTQRWKMIGGSFPSVGEHSGEVYEAIVAMKPPDEVLPMVLLRQSEALSKADSMRAWEVEREAIHHPEFSGFSRSSDQHGDQQLRAESHGDYETALYLELLSPRPEVGSCIPGDRSDQIGREFRRVYFRLRLEVDPETRWNDLIRLLPATAEDGSSRGLHRALYLDRVLEAAHAAHAEDSALTWFRSVRDSYHKELGQPAMQKDHGWSESDLLQVEKLFDGYIQQLERERLAP